MKLFCTKQIFETFRTVENRRNAQGAAPAGGDSGWGAAAMFSYVGKREGPKLFSGLVDISFSDR